MQKRCTRNRERSLVLHVNEDVLAQPLPFRMTSDLISHWFLYSGEGSHQSSNSDERTFASMARAIAVHQDTQQVMYFA